MDYDLEAQFDVVYEGDEARINCPFCGDDEGHHLYINEKKGVYHCFKCDQKGTLRSLIREFKLETIDTAYKEFEHRDIARSLDQVDATERHLYQIHLEDFRLIDTSPRLITDPYYHYAQSRGLTENLIKFYQLRYSNSGKYRYRIVIPCFENGQFVYFTARTVLSNPDTKRYINPPKGLTPKTRADVLFNIDNIHEGFPCVVMEGAVNAMITGKEAVATFGKCVSESQIRMLVEKNCSEYTVALDGDARRESLNLCKKLLSFGKQVRLAAFSVQEDPAILGKEATRKILAAAKVLNYGDIDYEMVREGLR